MLTEEQRAWVRQIYNEPTRIFILSMARKNAKTAFSSFLLLLHLCGPEARQNSQLFSAAQSREQAAILFGYASKVVRMSPVLRDFVTVRDTAKQLFCPELGTLYRALSAEASTAYGLSPVFTVHDELGQVKGPRSELYEAIETASAAQESPLSIVISTQAPTDADLLSLLIDDALTGADPRNKAVLYSAPMALDPFGDEAIRAANPHFDVFMNQDEVRRQAQDAKRLPSRESAYRNLILNQRVEAKAPFVSRSVWESCGSESASLDGMTVFGGLDLSARADLTAFVIAGRGSDGVWRVVPYFWTPEQGLGERAKRDRQPYDVWVREGCLRTTPGATVDYGFVVREIAEITSMMQVQAIGYDRWRIDLLKREAEAAGLDFPLVEFGQGFKDMSPALDSMEAEMLNGRIAHGMHPVLTMCAANAVAIRDPSGNRKLDKSKTTGRIDGMIAMAMAIGLGCASGDDSAAFNDFIFNPVGGLR